MSKMLTEHKVLKKLGIQDFPQMKEDKIACFASMLPKMNPEVAKKALGQLPEFAASAKEIVSYLKDTIDKGFAANNDSVQSFNKTCDNISAALDKQLENEELSFEQKNIIIDKMISLAGMKRDKDTENKRFILDIVGTVGSCLFCIFVLKVASLGLQTDALAAPASNNSDSCDDIIEADYASC